MKLPEIDLEELENFKEQNFKERLEFIDKYAEWVKKKNNSGWSSQQNNVVGK